MHHYFFNSVIYWIIRVLYIKNNLSTKSMGDFQKSIWITSARARFLDDWSKNEPDEKS